MHIAVCDDNVADRKQLERLLKRESDKRAASTGIIYTDSFGNSTSLLSNPMQYDAFYIDMCLTEGITGTEVANALIAQGVNAPIVLCCSKINYREQTYPENVIFLDKPIKVAELGQSIDHALDIMSKAVPLIELREDEDTVYATEPDILYAEEEGGILKKLAEDGIVFEGADKADLTLLTEPAEKELIRHIADFPGEIISAAKSYDPARITRYVTELANRYHKFYNSCRVKDAEHCVCQARIALCTATKNVISNALTLLKITVPESM